MGPAVREKPEALSRAGAEMAEEWEGDFAKSCARLEAAATADTSGSPAGITTVAAESSEREGYSRKCVFCRIAGQQEPGTELLYCEVGGNARLGVGGGLIAPGDSARRASMGGIGWEGPM